MFLFFALVVTIIKITKASVFGTTLKPATKKLNRIVPVTRTHCAFWKKGEKAQCSCCPISPDKKDSTSSSLNYSK